MLVRFTARVQSADTTTEPQGSVAGVTAVPHVACLQSQHTKQTDILSVQALCCAVTVHVCCANMPQSQSTCAQLKVSRENSV